jgi:DNA repair ATPase RecN
MKTDKARVVIDSVDVEDWFDKYYHAGSVPHTLLREYNLKLTAVEQLEQKLASEKMNTSSLLNATRTYQEDIMKLTEKLAAAEARVKELESNLEDEIKISRKISYQQDAIEWQNKWREVSEKIAAQEQEIERLNKIISILETTNSKFTEHLTKTEKGGSDVGS